MQLSGEYVSKVAPEQVYAFMLDPDVLKDALPGCERLEPIGEDAYEATMTIGIGMIKGKYNGKVAIVDKNEPTSFRMQIQGKGPQGEMTGDGLIELAPQGDGTKISWSGDAQVRGVLARIGARVIQPAAKQIVGQFFKRMEEIAQTRAA
jgi:carbon monoxide dehydrogenase subunit G